MLVAVFHSSLPRASRVEAFSVSELDTGKGKERLMMASISDWRSEGRSEQSFSSAKVFSVQSTRSRQRVVGRYSNTTRPHTKDMLDALVLILLCWSQWSHSFYYTLRVLGLGMLDGTRGWWTLRYGEMSMR